MRTPSEAFTVIRDNAKTDAQSHRVASSNVLYGATLVGLCLGLSARNALWALGAVAAAIPTVLSYMKAAEATGHIYACAMSLLDMNKAVVDKLDVPTPPQFFPYQENP